MSKRRDPITGFSKRRKPRHVPGFPGYMVCNDGMIYKQLGDGSYKPLHRYPFGGRVYVKLDWQRVEAWMVVCLAYGLGNPEELDVRYNDGNRNNLNIKNLSFLNKRTGGKHLRFEPAGELGEANVSLDPHDARDTLINSAQFTEQAIRQFTALRRYYPPQNYKDGLGSR